jgi:hypothetical protein
LWNVKDEATAELMKRFYRAMFKENLSPAAALRAAQVSMWKEKRWVPPYYWAALRDYVVSALEVPEKRERTFISTRPASRKRPNNREVPSVSPSTSIPARLVALPPG